MAKGSNAMSNKKYTADMVGSLNGGQAIMDGGGLSMDGARDRKGGTVMSNSRMTSDMSNGYDVIGAASVKDLRVAAATVNIDKRICGVLRGGPSSPRECYAQAINATSVASFNDCATRLLISIAGDEGVASLVASVVTANAQFGGLGLLQRAIVRRLEERRKSFIATGTSTLYPG